MKISKIDGRAGCLRKGVAEGILRHFQWGTTILRERGGGKRGSIKSLL